MTHELRRAAFGALVLAASLSLFAGASLAREGKKHAAPAEKTAPTPQTPVAEPPPPAPAATTAAPEAKPETPKLDPKAEELTGAFKDGYAAATKGPAKVPLVDQATIQLQTGQAFIPQAQCLRILRALGNSPSAEGMMGLILGAREQDSWIVVVRLVKEGYIKDDDAKNWSADDLLNSIKEGTEEANKDREQRGFTPIEVVGWVERPTYDSGQRRLVWSMLSKEKGAPDNEVRGVNYNTYALGRDGYFSLNMLSDSQRIEQDKPIAKALLANLAYNPGKRYDDFNQSTDNVAAYGLAALVGGVAAKKLGLLALGAAFFAKFAKLILLGVAGVGAMAAKFFKRDKNA